MHFIKTIAATVGAATLTSAAVIARQEVTDVFVPTTVTASNALATKGKTSTYSTPTTTILYLDGKAAGLTPATATGTTTLLERQVVDVTFTVSITASSEPTRTTTISYLWGSVAGLKPASKTASA